MKKLSLVALALSIAQSVAARDQENNPFSPWYLADQPAGWYYDTVLGIEREPAYTGSDQYEAEADLELRAIYRSETGNRYFVSLGEVGAVVPLEPDLIFVTVLEYEEGRERENDPILREFDEVEETLEAQITLVKRWGPWSLGGVFQPDILDRGKGLVYFIGLGYDRHINPMLRFYAGLDLSWGDAEHLGTEIGVSNDVAARSGLDPYDPEGGYKSTTLSLGLGYAIRPDLELIFEGEAEFYADEMAASPLIRVEGDDVNYELGLGLRYAF